MCDPGYINTCLNRKMSKIEKEETSEPTFGGIFVGGDNFLISTAYQGF